jgi:hypothetical protein
MSSHNRLTRSARLKKYEIKYNSCIQYIEKQKHAKKRTQPIKKPRSKRTEENTQTVKKCVKENKDEKIKKKLNIYQKFVQEESKKNKYSGMEAKERMTKIGIAWKAKKIR